MIRIVVCHTHVQVYGSTAEQLKAYRVNVAPPMQNWVEVEDALYFQQVMYDKRLVAVRPLLMLLCMLTVITGKFAV